MNLTITLRNGDTQNVTVQAFAGMSVSQLRQSIGLLCYVLGIRDANSIVAVRESVRYSI